MDEKKWKQAEEEFNVIYDLNARERDSYFEKLRQEKPKLYELVKELWDYSLQTGSFLKSDVINNFETLVQDFANNDIAKKSRNMAGREVGKFKIIKKLGIGGMGAIYLAERADGSYDQKVALKFIRTELKSDVLIERFKREQQIQAMLAHPSIPALFDADIDEHGVPYIVMEYVEGQTIREYIEQRKLSLVEKLSIFIQICDIIHFAHQNLVIHRDLKPSNILITAEGKCKLLDFGISKLLDDNSGADLTLSDMHFLSLRYAAPEQLKHQPVTTATDIYSLGVILHEMLCGTLPYQIESKTLGEIEQAICEKDIPKPSTRILRSDAEDAASASSLKLSRVLKGDLDNIILKALEKEPVRRYSSVKEFSDDIQRFLNNEPVTARPAGLLYTSGKFIRRNKIAVGTALTIFFTLLSGFIYHSVTISAERDIARLEAEKFKQMSGFLIDLFDYDDLAVLPEEASIANLLESGVNRIDAELSNNPEVQTEILLAIGRSYLRLGNIASGYEMIAKAATISETLPKSRTLKKSEVYYNLGNAKMLYGHPDTDEIIEKTIEIAKEESGEVSYDYAEALWLKANSIYKKERGRTPESEAISEQYLEIIQQIFNKDTPEYGLAVSEYATYRVDINERLEALKKAVQVNENIHGRYHPRVANVLNTLGFNYRSVNLDSAITYFNQAIHIYTELYGEAHFRTINSLTNLGDSYRRTGDFEKSTKTFQRAVSAGRLAYPEGSIRIADPQYWLANAQIEMGLYEEAEKNLREVFVVYESNYEPGTQRVEMARTNLGYAIKLQGRTAQGTKLIEQSIKNVKQLHGEDHNLINFAKSRL